MDQYLCLPGFYSLNPSDDLQSQVAFMTISAFQEHPTFWLAPHYLSTYTKATSAPSKPIVHSPIKNNNTHTNV